MAWGRKKSGSKLTKNYLSLSILFVIIIFFPSPRPWLRLLQPMTTLPTTWLSVAQHPCHSISSLVIRVAIVCSSLLLYTITFASLFFFLSNEQRPLHLRPLVTSNKGNNSSRPTVATISVSPFYNTGSSNNSNHVSYFSFFSLQQPTSPTNISTTSRQQDQPSTLSTPSSLPLSSSSSPLLLSCYMWIVEYEL